MPTDHPTRARSIVVALYRGKVVARWSAGGSRGGAPGRAKAGGSPRAGEGS